MSKSEFDIELEKTMQGLKKTFIDENFKMKTYLSFIENHIIENKEAIDELNDELGLFDEKE